MPGLQLWSEFFEGDELNVICLDDNSFWFQASKLCAALGYKNTQVAIKTHCEDYEIQKLDIGQHQDVNFISESGFYSLVLGSKKEKAKAFKKWVCSEVLPKLRADRFVSLPGMDQYQIYRARRELDQRETEFRLLKAEVQELKEANKLYQGQIRVKSAEWMTIEAFLRRYKFQMVNYHGEVHTKDYVRCKMYFKESMQQVSRHFCHSEIVDRFDWLWDDFALFPKEQVMDWLYNPSIYEKFPRRFLFALMESNLLGWGLSQYTDFRFVEREPLQGWLAQRQER